MTLRSALMKLVLQEDLNFLITNRLPRRFATKLVGRLARVEHAAVRAPMIAAWRFFSGVDLSDSATMRFRSLREAFIRPLKSGARAFAPDPAVIASPCDAIVGAHGAIEDGRVYQVKGFPYRLDELVPDAALAARFAYGRFVTLRLTAGMYHRFHAPADLSVEAVTYLSGDCWNVNPIALKRVERLFCRNERAVVETQLADGTPMLLVPVAAILVASIRLTFLDTPALLRERGPGRVTCDARLAKGEEMGWFEHGSTIIAILPREAELAPGLVEGQPIRAGEALAQL
ncbi:archaetidylserine decarboxylase [Sphingomonas jeddahensis]|uniref:phosphatidylserine decarboxylase n=1 Tax=Sphingomonas jeddahensis TaxID=1915074 RepID=A0A1V2EXD4_9SPHN|nr:archaetidylserine decarboxylase [Sphingomonas jeddahensis]ONF96814.1 Phosphatidylserine decarboxylase proenzyme [Sphingomonas jeddahensis]